MRVVGLIRARRLDRDLRQQIASHIEEATDEYVRQGLSAEDARRKALRSFGNVGRTEEAWREARSFVSLDHLRRDVRYAGRALRRDLVFSLVVVIVLAIATGAVTSIFALLNAVVLEPLPFVESDRLVIIRHAAPGLGLDDAGVSSGLYFHYSETAHSLESLAVYKDPIALNLRLPGEGTARVNMSYASAAVFKVLRTSPALGRLFTEEDGRPGFMNMTWQIPVLLSHEFWVSRFGADPNVIGRVLTTSNNSPREVIGVLPQGFAFPGPGIQMWILIEPRRAAGSVTRDLSWNVVARLRRGATAAAAQTELTDDLNGMSSVEPDVTKARLLPVVIPLKTAVIGDAGQTIWLLFGGMVLLLIVSCANVSGLFVARAEHRTREVSVRRALGAHGSALARMFVVEALLLTGAAAAVGVLLARGALSALVAFAYLELPRTAEIALGPAAFVFALVLAVAMAGFYGLLSARRQYESLTVGFVTAGRSVKRRGGLWRPDTLIVLQVALALTLLVGSALMVVTYQNLSRRDLGFSPDDVLTVEMGLPGRKARQHARIYGEVVERIRQLPEVERASIASFVPLTATEHLYPVEAGTAPVAIKFFVPGYFQTIGTPILDGAGFAAGETVTAPYPVLVSAALARRLYPGERAIGKPVRRLNEDGTVVDMGRGPVPPFTIAGIVADVREMTLRERPTEIVYIPMIDPPVEQSIVPTDTRIVVRTRAPFDPLVAAIRQTIAGVDPDLSVGRIQTMSSIVRAGRAREAFVGVLLLAAAGVSLLLGTIGIYGSVAQVVRRRTREIGIRLALGAARVDVVRLVTAGSARAVLFGGALGLLASFVAVGMLDSLLFGVNADDPFVFVAVTAGLISSGVAAALLAARHATRIAPLMLLRGE